jgi:hypothetical protein
MEILKYYNKRRRLHENTKAPCLELQEDNDSCIKITSWGGDSGLPGMQFPLDIYEPGAMCEERDHGCYEIDHEPHY